MPLPFFKPKTDEVLNHTMVIAPHFSMSPQEFYAMVEKELQAHKLPGLEISRVEYAEGGLLSHNRVYLRLIRERLAFDACAAPFGTEYLFSCRSVYSPVKVTLGQLLLACMAFIVLFSLLTHMMGMLFAGIAIGALAIALAAVFHNAVALNLADLDTMLLKTPILSPIYERWFRKDTYFRQDTRMAYLEIVTQLIKELIDEVTAREGVKLVRRYERAPVFGDLYKPIPPVKKLEESSHERAPKGI